MAALPLANAHRTSREQRAQVQHAAEHASSSERHPTKSRGPAATAIERERAVYFYLIVLEVLELHSSQVKPSVRVPIYFRDGCIYSISSALKITRPPER